MNRARITVLAAAIAITAVLPATAAQARPAAEPTGPSQADLGPDHGSNGLRFVGFVNTPYRFYDASTWF